MQKGGHNMNIMDIIAGLAIAGVIIAGLYIVKRVVRGYIRRIYQV